MRQISSDLQAVQQVRSPRARVSVTVEARGQNPTVPALAWSELVGNSGQEFFRPVALVGLANGSILKFVAYHDGLRMYTITNPHLAASWTEASYSTIIGAGLLTLAALRVPNTSTIRLFYIGSSNHVQYIESSNNGVSWGSAVTVYAGGDAVIDLVCAYINNGVTANGPWFFGFSTQSGGVYTPRFGYHNGSSWVTSAYEAGWRAAGIDAYGEVTAAHRCLVVKQHALGPSRLRVLEKSGATYSNARDLDHTQAGLFGLELAHYRFCQLPEAGCMLAVMGESAYGAGAHLGVAGLFSSPYMPPGEQVASYDVLADEPVIFPQIEASKSEAFVSLCSVGEDVYLAGETVVWRGARQKATEATLTPIRYLYDDHQVEIEFAAGIEALYVGQILVIERELSWGAQSGSECFRAIIVRVEQGTDKVKVIALDALGWLGTARCRRPCILNDGTASGVAKVMRKLAARFGIEVTVDNSDLESEAVMPFTLAPAESLRGAAYRVGSQSEWYLVPANDGSFRLTMMTPGTSDSGDYDDTAHVYGGSEAVMARAVAVSDYRVLAFSYVLGTRSTDPEDGGAVAMAAGSPLPNTRPLSYSLTNSRYNTQARVVQAAAAEGARQRKLPITGMIEGNANLALEIYDKVVVTEPLLGWNARAFRVRRIAERWEQGRLTQTIYLGDE